MNNIEAIADANGTVRLQVEDGLKEYYQVSLIFIMPPVFRFVRIVLKIT